MTDGGPEPLPDVLARALGRPEPFAPHDAPFWDDPNIASQMLVAHLDARTDAASRRPKTIGATVDHLVVALELAPGSRVLDPGCGPGLYANELARRGLHVTGIDLSAGSIEYARKRCLADGLDIDYRVGDYTRVDLGGPYGRCSSDLLRLRRPSRQCASSTPYRAVQDPPHSRRV